MSKIKAIIYFSIINIIFSQKILIPMDQTQTDHIKAYGIAFWSLKNNQEVDWLLNYRDGAFMMDSHQAIKTECLLRGVQFETVDANQYGSILSTINDNNMDIALLETVPKIAVYTPDGKQPWDDAVTLALTYAEIEYKPIFDDEVMTGDLSEYDWLHLHHEDFTGQYGKFYKQSSNRVDVAERN